MPLKEFPNPYTALKLLESTSLRSFALQLRRFQLLFCLLFYNILYVTIGGKATVLSLKGQAYGRKSQRSS